jgi:hypothetical protein
MKGKHNLMDMDHAVDASAKKWKMYGERCVLCAGLCAVAFNHSAYLIHHFTHSA